MKKKVFYIEMGPSTLNAMKSLHSKLEWVSEWLNLTAFLGTADSKLDFTTLPHLF